MGRARIIKGVGRETNPFDGDHVVIELGVRDGKIAYIGAIVIRTTAMTWVVDARQEVTFKTGAEARANSDETFAGCETARNAAMTLHKVFIGRELEEALAIDARDLITKMDVPPGNEHCARTVLAAARNALIDVQVTTLAEAIVEVRRLRDTG